MALVTMKEMLNTARRKGYAVGAFEFWSYDSAMAVILAANKLHRPVILQVGHFERDYMDSYINAYRVASMAAQSAENPVALHLDHAEDYAEVMRALDAGFTSVMIDASARPFDENAEITSAIVRTAKVYGASVEAELGALGGTEGNIAGGDGSLTNPKQAKEFVDKTGIDALAVAIGTAHGFYKSEPKLDIPRLKEISGRVSIPLVLHGGSGTPEDKVREAISNGVAKVNICTEFIAAFGGAFSLAQNKDGFTYNVFSLFKAGRDAGQALVEEKMKLFGGKL